MTKPWNAVVIGAGVGGLAAAATLVKAGKRVVVVDGNPHIGGTAYVYQRKGFTFPMGPLGFSTPDLVGQALSDLGTGQVPEFRRVHYRIKAFGLEVPLSLPFERMQERLSQLFPQDAAGIKAFFQEMANVVSAMQSPHEKENRRLLSETGNIPAAEYLRSLLTDWRLQRFLGSLGTHEPYSSAALTAAMWHLMSNQGIWYPSGGMRSFCDKLAQAAVGSEEKGGGACEIRLGAGVQKIRVRDGNVLGVTLADGTELDAEGVISNADFKTTFLGLMEPEEVPAPWRGAVTKARQTGSIFQVAVGVDSRRVDLSAFSRASRILYRSERGLLPDRPEGANWRDRAVDLEALVGQELEVSLLTGDDPTLAPSGGSVILIRTEAEHAHFGKYRLSPGRRTDDYKAYKRSLGSALLREAAQLIPGLEEAILVVDVATPLTFQDQGGRSEGAVAGWSWDYEDTADYEPKELILTPIRGLYMAGYQAYSNLFMGGVPTAMTSGRRAAEFLLQGRGPVEEVNIPGCVP